MPGSVFGNTLKRRFLSKTAIIDHIKKAIINNNKDRLKYYIGLIDDINGKYISYDNTNSADTYSSFLDFAAFKGSEDCFHFLRDAGVKPGVDTLIYACQSSVSPVIVRALILISKVDVNAKGSKGFTPLMTLILEWYHSSREQRLEIFNDLINNGANVNIIYTGKDVETNNYGVSMGSSILMMACNTDTAYEWDLFLIIIRAILDKGANIDWVNSNGETALHYACKHAKEKIVEILIGANANVNIQDNNGRTSLMKIASQSFYGNSEIETALKTIKLLMTNRPGPLEPINLDLQDNDGNTALMLAVRQNRNVSQLLITSGANVDIVNKDGEDAQRRALYAFKSLFGKKNKKKDLSIWKGWTQSDIIRLDGLFTGTKPEDYSYCPVCLKHTTRPAGCMYMLHNCTDKKGYYNEYLYDTYNNNGNIQWCTICNRITKHHMHFELSSFQNEANLSERAIDAFGHTCLPVGGGLKEKILRFRAIREKAYELIGSQGKITNEEAMEELVKASWNAPLERPANLPRDFENSVLRTHAFNRPLTNYPENRGPNANENTKIPDIPLPPDRKMPIVIEGTDALSMDDGEVIVFQHPVKGGKNYHGEIDPASFVSRDSLKDVIVSRIKSFANDGQPIGTCWDRVCPAIMYPAEIQPYVEPELYEKYRETFNRARAEKKGGGNSKGLLLPLTDAECSLPPRVKKSSGGRIRTRKNKHRVTRRKRNRKYKPTRSKRY